MIDIAKVGNTTLVFNDDNADPEKAEEILRRIGDIYFNDILQQKLLQQEKNR